MNRNADSLITGKIGESCPAARILFRSVSAKFFQERHVIFKLHAVHPADAAGIPLFFRKNDGRQPPASSDFVLLSHRLPMPLRSSDSTPVILSGLLSFRVSLLTSGSPEEHPGMLQRTGISGN